MRQPHPGHDLGVRLAPGRLAAGCGTATSSAGPPLSRFDRRDLLPSRWFPASITRPSVVTGRPSAAASGAIVSWARSSGEQRRCTMSRSRRSSADPLGHLPAELGQVVVGQPAVEHPGRGCPPRRAGPGARSSGCSSPRRLRPRAAARGGRAAARRRSGPWLHHRGPRTKTNPRTRWAAGRRPASSMAWKNAAYARCDCVARGGVVGHGGHSSATKKTLNKFPAGWMTCGTPAAPSARARPRLQRRPRPVDVGVDLRGGQPQGGQPGRGRDRVARQRAGLVDPADRGEVLHQLGPAAERRRREAAAHHLAEGHQVGPRRRRGRTARCGLTRNPVITSSEMNRAPWSRADLGQEGVEADAVLDAGRDRRPCCRRPPR